MIFFWGGAIKLTYICTLDKRNIFQKIKKDKKVPLKHKDNFFMDYRAYTLEQCILHGWMNSWNTIPQNKPNKRKVKYVLCIGAQKFKQLHILIENFTFLWDYFLRYFLAGFDQYFYQKMFVIMVLNMYIYIYIYIYI